jgi:ATP-dependent helicase/nuclease subunit A
MRSLTVDQEVAVTRRRGSLLLAAGAGSGKTAVLVERFVRAVREDGISPRRVLAITFTERAAAELRERLRARLLELGEREAARDTEGAPIGTFHAFCARLLRIHALTAGLDPDFAILDEPSAVRLRQLAFRRALGALLGGGRREEMVDLVAAYGADRVQRMIMGAYAEQRSRGVSLPRLPPAAPSTDHDALRSYGLLGAILECFGDGYDALKRARPSPSSYVPALDFDDLELFARDLLTRDESVRRAWSERIELMMVDEFQDTNRRQLELLELLERDNLFTVGDELQAIYGFRHAEVAIFRERRRRLNAEGAAVALARNFRSRPALLDAVSAVFGERFGDAYTPPVAVREHHERGGPRVELLLTDRRCWAQSPHAKAVAGTLPPATLWRQAEARLQAQRVAELVDAHEAAAGEVAVLLRAAGDLPVYEQALQERGLRTLAAVGSFWGHQQVGDLLMWLRALANPLDELALYSALASPLVGISSDGLARIALSARAAGTGAWAAIVADEQLCAQLAPADRERLVRFAEHFDDERRLAPIVGPAGLLVRAIAHGDYERQVLSLAWGERRLANVHKLLRLARHFESAEGPDVRGFLDHVAHRRMHAEGAEPHAPTGSEPDAVRLMTIHAAKGLEFPVVCIADLGRNGNGTPPDLLIDRERVGLRLARLDGSSTACLHFEELWQERRRAEAAEEERIVYVAMTRARERLLMSGACDFARWPSGVGLGEAPINWIAPALVPELPALTRTLEQPVAELPIAGGGGADVRCWLNSPATVGRVLHVRRCGAAMLVP